MKSFIVFIVVLVLLNVVNCVEFKEYDLLYDDPIEERDTSVEIEEVYVRPKYHIKDAQTLFVKFVSDFKKKYKDEDDSNKHYATFVKNLKEIIVNNKNGGGSVSDINSFADYDDEELSKFIG